MSKLCNFHRKSNKTKEAQKKSCCHQKFSIIFSLTWNGALKSSADRKYDVTQVIKYLRYHKHITKDQVCFQVVVMTYSLDWHYLLCDQLYGLIFWLALTILYQLNLARNTEIVS